MANAYSYTFASQLTGQNGAPSVQISGSYNVDYDTLRVYNINVTANNLKFTSGFINEVSNPNGTIGYNVQLSYSPFSNDSNYVNLYSNSQTSTTYTGIRYLRSFTDNSVFPATSTVTISQQGSVPVAVAPVCFVTGARIRTDRGEVAVEDLRIGDQAVTSSGALRPVVWIGHRTVRCQGRKDLLPVRISKGAFGPDRPTRDLVVSPGHALCVDLLGEVLIPACRLINGTTITQVAAETVTYWHVELDAHDILLAEGMPAESYLDCGNRRFFANADAIDFHAQPDARAEGPPLFCRPFHETGPIVDFARARLGDRAAVLGWHLVEDRIAGLHLVADGRVIDADINDLTARFVLPAGARDVRLVSETSVPAHVLPDTTDDRRLGLPVMGLAIDGVPVAIDDPRLCVGWHSVDEGTRWTEGAAVLPAALWEGRQGTVTLQVDLSVPALPRWVAPASSVGETAVMAA